VATSMMREREEAAGAAASRAARASSTGGAAPSGTRRLEALRSRVLQKQDSEAERSAHRAAVDALERQMCTCEDAMAVHAVVRQLFARGKGKDSAASEAEVMVAVCSESFSAQCHRPLSRESARTAIAYLERKATNWYSVEAAVHSRHAGAYLRRIPGGSSEAVREAISNDIRELKESHGSLISKPSLGTQHHPTTTATAAATTTTTITTTIRHQHPRPPMATNGLKETACLKAVDTPQQTGAIAAARSNKRRRTKCIH